ncbi:hypothetical protein LCGC14_3104120, partial [marine sediment metagenome]
GRGLAPVNFGAATWGFGEARSDGTTGLQIASNQPSIYGGANAPNDADSDWAVLQGIGLESGDRNDEFWTPQTGLVSTPVSWEADVLLASGTYEGVNGWIHVSGGTENDNTAGWNVLAVSSKGDWVGPGLIDPPAAVNGDSVYIVPEPTTFVMLAIASLGLLLLRRRRNG